MWSLNSNNHQRPPHMNGSTLKSIVSATLHPALIEKIAAKHALVLRSGGLVCPCDLVLSLCVASCVGPDRSIAEARRQWELIAGRTIARSSFDAHFDKDALSDSIWDLLRSTMRRSNRALRRQWPCALRDLFDVMMDDGSRARLRREAKEEFPATDEEAAGVKLMARMALGECKLTEASVGAARTHDHALRTNTKFKAKVLYLRDLGFYDHREFAAICAAGAFFVSRWKEGVTAVVRGHASGLLLPESLAQEQSLDRSDVLGRTSDVDAELKVENGSTLPVRLVRVRFVVVDKRGKETGEQERWYVTNLPRERWDVDAISTAYRLRWLVERAFRRMKHVARMDHLQTSRPTAVMALLGAALLVSALAERVHYELAREEGITKVSLDRCQLVLCSALPRIVQRLIDEHAGRVLNFDAVARVVTHESRHPNPSQPHLVCAVFSALAECRTKSSQRCSMFPSAR